jgi:hypothetical protein
MSDENVAAVPPDGRERRGDLGQLRGDRRDLRGTARRVDGVIGRIDEIVADNRGNVDNRSATCNTRCGRSPRTSI